MPTTIDQVIDYMEATREDSWMLDVCRSKDGSKNCFLGHLFNMGRDDKHANEIIDYFESHWANTYMFYAINDGEDTKYPQPSAKQRIVAYLKDLRDGKEKNIVQLIDEYETEPSDVV